jgi:hypothetical protein
VTWWPGQAITQVGYSHYNFFSDSAGFDYLSRASEYFFGRAGWRFAEQTQAGVEASGSLTAYDLHLQSDNQSVSVGPYLEWQITRTFGVSLRGGPTVYWFDANRPGQAGSELSSYYAGVQVTHQLTDFILQSLSVVRDVRLGVNQGSDYIEELTGLYSVSWALTRRVSVGVNVGYEHGTQPLPSRSGAISEVYDRYFVGGSLSYRFSHHLSTGLTFQRWERISNITSQFGYSQDTLGLQAAYNF